MCMRTKYSNGRTYGPFLLVVNVVANNLADIEMKKTLGNAY